MLRMLATSLSIAFATSFVFGVAVPTPSAYGATKPGDGKKVPPKKKGKKKKGPVAEGKGPFKKDEYPLQERNRPLILPDQMGEVTLDLGYSRFLDTDFVATTIGFNYGLGDVVELGVGTGLLLAPDVASNETIVVQAHWLAYDEKYFDFAPGLVIPFTFSKGAGFGATIDLTSRYVVSKTVFLTFGQGAIPVIASPDFGLAVVANGGVGYQVGKPTVLFADTSVFTLLLAPDVDVTGLWETLVLGVGGQYSPTPEWDIGARLTLGNTWSVSDSLTFGLGAFAKFRF